MMKNIELFRGRREKPLIPPVRCACAARRRVTHASVDDDGRVPRVFEVVCMCVCARLKPRNRETLMPIII